MEGNERFACLSKSAVAELLAEFTGQSPFAKPQRGRDTSLMP